eukprot:Skav202805  [mRNA]  locus=scaffold326:893421:893831:+ [translate_table: standard]
MKILQRITAEDDVMKIKVVDKNAILPEKRREVSVAYDLATHQSIMIPAGEGKLISMGYCLQLPKKTCGRVVSQNTLSAQGVEVGGGVIDPDQRGELRVVLHNRGMQKVLFRPGDVVAQLVVEKVSNDLRLRIESRL